MGSELSRVMQKYRVPNQGMAQTLGAMGRYGDSLVAHITPEEAMMLKRQGGAGTINPLTGMLEFYDADGSGNAADSGNPTGGDTGGGGGDNGSWGGGDWGANVDFGGPMGTPSLNDAVNAAIDAGAGPVGPSTVGIADYGIASVPSYDAGFGGPMGGGFAGDNAQSGMANVFGNSTFGGGFAGDNAQSGMANVSGDGVASTTSDSGGYNNAGGNDYFATDPGVTTAPITTTTPTTTTTPVTTTPATNTTTPTSNFQFAPYSAPASYGFELNRLMQQYGLSTPTMMPFAGYATPKTPDDALRAEYDKAAYQNYADQFNNRLAQTNMYNRAQFVPDSTKFTPQYSAPLANPTYAPANYGGIYNTYTKYFGRAPEEAGIQYWGKMGATGDALQNAILSGAQNADLDYLRSKYPDLAPAPAPAPALPAPLPGTGDNVTQPGTGGGFAYTADFGPTSAYGAGTVYGPDGTMYPNPAAAHQAGVRNYTFDRPAATFARGGAVKANYAEGGEVEEPETERSNRGPLTPEGAARMAALLNQMRPTTNYGAQLASAQQAARGETEAFSNMIRQMSERAESPTSRAEMYFRLASAFGAPTRTGQFTENLGLAGQQMGEYARGRRTDEAERRALALRAQELRMAGARQDLASLQTLAGQEAAAQRAINLRMIDAQARAGAPNARETRINDTMQTFNVDRPTAIRIVDNLIVAVPGSAGEPPTFFDRITREIIVPGGVTQSAPNPPRETTPQPAAAPTQAEAPAIDLRRPQAAATTAPATAAAPTSVEDLYAGRRMRQVEQAGRTAEAEARGRVAAPPAPRQDFRYTQDFQAVEPIPGSVAAQEAEQRARAERVRRESEQQAGFTVMRAIDDAERTIRTAVLPTTGFFAERLSGVGGTAARNLRADLETIRANIGFDQLNQMRQASPTGGALGNVTIQELTFLQSVMGSVDQSQTEDQFLRNLRRLRDAFEEVIHYGRGNRPQVQIPGPGGRGTAEPPRAAGAAPAASGEIRTPTGLVIRPIQ